MKAKRRYLTKKERSDMHALQGGLCACGCDQPLGAKFIAEHWHCVALGNGEKPDALFTLACASRKTKKDIRDIWHVKRIKQRAEGTRRQRKPIANRGFDKSRRRKMNGTVEVRT